MNVQRLHLIAKYLFCLGITGAAISELLQADTVVQSMDGIGVARRLLYALGACKLSGVAVLMFSRNKRLLEWAYAGFCFNLLGAIYMLVTANQTILPDLFIAPTYLTLWLVTNLTYRRVEQAPKQDNPALWPRKATAL